MDSEKSATARLVEGAYDGCSKDPHRSAYPPMPPPYTTQGSMYHYPVPSPPSYGLGHPQQQQQNTISTLPPEVDTMAYPYSHVTFTVTAQQERSPDFLWLSIFTCLCCCWPVGIVAVVYSVLTRNSNDSGNLQKARLHSRIALSINCLAIILGVIWMLSYASARYVYG